MKTCQQVIKRINEIAIALSSERDVNLLLEQIVVGCKELTCADAGSLYLMVNRTHLKFEIVRTDSKSYAMGGSSGNAVNFPLIPIYDEDAIPNLNMVVVASVIQQQSIHIEDIYSNRDYDFSGTKKFDQSIGYHSQSVLTIPMEDHLGQVVGAVQLINSIDEKTGQIVPFSEEKIQIAQSLTSMAAVAYSRKKLEDSMHRYVALQSSINHIFQLALQGNSRLNSMQQFADILFRLPLQIEIISAGLANIENKQLTDYKVVANEKNRLDCFIREKLTDLLQQNIQWEQQVYWDNSQNDQETQIIYLPIISQQQVLVLLMFVVKGTHYIEIEDEFLLQELADVFSSALNFLQQNKKNEA